MNKIVYFDFLRTISIIGVIFIHASAVVVGDYAAYSKTEWMIGNLYNSLFRWSVPIFVMISGALLLTNSKLDSITSFYKKRAFKVLVPLLFWGSVYYIYKNRYQMDVASTQGFLLDFIKGPVYYPLWFLYMILFLYMITPFLVKILKFISQSNLKAFLIVWFFVISLYNTICLFLEATQLYTTEIPTFIGQFAAGFLYIGYYLLGYYLTKFEIKINWLYTLGIVGLLFTFFGTYFITSTNNIFGSFFYNYLNFNIVLVSITVFLLFKNSNVKPNKIVSMLSYLSFGIYLVHVIIMEYLFRLFNVDFHSNFLIFSIPFYSIFVLILSALFTYIIKKVPILRNVIP